MGLNVYMLIVREERLFGSTFLMRGFMDLRSCATRDVGRKDGMGRL